MSEPFMGEIRVFTFNYAPRGWAFCNGQTMAINQNQALFSILGTTYGGDGVTTFKVPNLQGATPVHVGAGIALGGTGGEAGHQLTINEIPAHTHVPMGASVTADSTSAAGGTWAAAGEKPYSLQANVNMKPAVIAAAGSNQAHSNMQPYLVTNFCIALQGIYPTRN
jgi:microcystin-dependent protein